MAWFRDSFVFYGRARVENPLHRSDMCRACRMLCDLDLMRGARDQRAATVTSSGDDA